jgi:hypothetical protein
MKAIMAQKMNLIMADAIGGHSAPLNIQLEESNPAKCRTTAMSLDIKSLPRKMGTPKTIDFWNVHPYVEPEALLCPTILIPASPAFQNFVAQPNASH